MNAVKTGSAKVFVLTGMGRSGTSLSASLLQAGGVNMGERQLGAHKGNAKGHFENKDFLDFHRSILRRANIMDAGWVSSGAIAVPADCEGEARKVIAANAAEAGPQGWGWKDPRTTLFLDYWANMVPEAVFIFIYRSAWEVVDSIFRRGVKEDLYFRDRPHEAVMVWMHYNQCVIDFMRQRPERSILVSCDGVAAAPADFVILVNQRFGAALSAPPADLVEPEIMHHDASTGAWPTLIAQAFPEAVDMMETLDSLCAMRVAALGPEALARVRNSRDYSTFFHGWFEQYQTQREAAKKAKYWRRLGRAIAGKG